MRTFKALAFTLLFFTSFTFFANANTSGIITNPLQEQMQNVAPGELIRINITLASQFDSQTLLSQVRSLRGEERRQYVIRVLKDFSALSQEGVIADLNRMQRYNSVEKVTTYWIANVINCWATPAAIEELALRHDIAEIDHDEMRIIIDPSENKNAFYEEGNPGNREITWNVLKINADDVWALGFNGDGIVVSVIDTGVNYNHVDLNDHVWTNPEYPYHGYDFVNNDNNPMDDHGHGTHCAGTVAGDGTAGSQTGVAPEATIMCCKVLDAGGSGSESGVWSAVEFSVEQGAHVMSLSLGWQHSWGVNRTVWRQTFNNSLAAGIIASVAAGNEGDQQFSYPIPDNVRTPGDLPPAWLHPDQTLTGGVSGIICVGASDINDNLAGFSSRGPVDWSAISPFNDYPYQPEMGLIRPDICAPGVNIKSLAYNSNTGYASGWDGTSMATPANAGMIALMLQKNNLLTPEEINQTIETTTQVLVAGKNNNSGSGRIDALAAVEATSLPGPSYYSHTINDLSGNNNGELDPAESVLLTLAMGNFSDEPADNVTVEISTESSFINITDNTEFFGNFGLESIIEIVDAFAFEVANNVPGGEPIKFHLLAYNADEAWESSFETVANGVNLVVGSLTISDISGNNNGSLDPGETADVLIEISNTGQIDAPSAMAYLATSSNFVTINTTSFNLQTLASGQTLTASFNISVSAATPVGTVVDLNFEAVSGFYNAQKIFNPKVGLIVEDFETGDFSQYEWQFAGNANWTVVSSGAFEGSYCAKSGAIGNNATTEMKLTIEVAANDSIAFYRKVSSEASYDFLQFYIDNNLKQEWSGEVAWGRVAFPVTAGEHTFRWVYMKDVYVVSGSDCAWVDFIELPAFADNTLAVNAGQDATVCEGVTFQTTAFAQNYTSLSWSTSGDGTFSSASTLNPVYTPGSADYQAGFAMLSLTAFGQNNQSITDVLQLSFDLLPFIPGTIAGPVSVCMGSTQIYTISGVEHADWYQWVLTPVEAGTLTGTNTESEIIWAQGFTGQAILKVQGMNDCGEGLFSEELTIQVDDCTGLNEISDDQTLTVTPNPSNGIFTLNLNTKTNAQGQITIKDIQGKVVYSSNFGGGQTINLDLNYLNDGLYQVTLTSQQLIHSAKLIIKK